MPFLALRSYLPADHPDKAKELGSEPTPGAFIDTLLSLTEEWARVLAPHGSICVELGDTYSGSGGAGGDYGPAGLRDGQEKFDGSASRTRSNRPGQYGTDDWPEAKSLCLIPELYRIGLVYGFNPLTGRQTPRWRARNVVRWCRPNPPVGALGDKLRPATSEMVIACKSKTRYFDLDAVRNPDIREPSWADGDPKQRAAREAGKGQNKAMADRTYHANGGAPPLDWWQIPTESYKGSHYACVDDQTEALTPEGWKRHAELEDGDRIAAYDADRAVIVWQAADFHRYPFAGELVAIEKRETSQRLTPNHRVIHRTRDGVVSTTRADALKPSWLLPVAAPFDVDGSGPGDVLAALLGWYVTEGSDRRTKKYIYQSETANPKHCNRIRDLLDAARATYTEKRRVRPVGATISPRESVEVHWVIEGAVAEWLESAAPGKRLTAEFLTWSDLECSALLDALIAGDGHTAALWPASVRPEGPGDRRQRPSALLSPWLPLDGLGSARWGLVVDHRGAQVAVAAWDQRCA